MPEIRQQYSALSFQIHLWLCMVADHLTEANPKEITKDKKRATTNEQTPEQVPVKMVKIDDEVIALEVVRRAEKRFLFEITSETGTAWSHPADEHKTANGAAWAGKPIWQ